MPYVVGLTLSAAQYRVAFAGLSPYVRYIDNDCTVNRVAYQDPGAGTIAERYFRLLVSVGDSLQRELEPALGAQQAGRVRDRVDGSRTMMVGCAAPSPQ